MSLTLIKKKPNFGLLWFAQLISFIGDGVFQLALIWWVGAKTNSGTMVGLILGVSALPPVLIGPFAGTLADRLPPKLILITADLLRAVIMGGFAYLAFIDVMELWHVFLLAASLSTAAVFHSPTTLTVIPQVVDPEDMDGAMALHSIVRDLAKLVGPALGGTILAWFSTAQAFAVDAFALAFSALIIAFIRLEHPRPCSSEEPVWTQLKQGIQYVRGQSLLFEMLIGFGVLNFFVIPIMVLLPRTIQDLLNLSSLHFGICEASLALGSVMAGLGFTRLFARIRLDRLLIRGIGLSGLLFALLAFNRFFPVLVVGLFLMGGCFAAVNITLMTMYQRKVLPEMKGRFFALVETLSYALFPISMAVSGYLSDKIGIPATYLFCATGILLLTIRFSRLPGLRALDEQPA
jgi:MFS family permease